jgi:hypothetical protein
VRSKPLFARSDSGAASSPAAAAWSAPTIEDSATAESGARSVARLVTTRAMNACQKPCFAFWRIACLVLSFARQTVTYSPLSKPQTRRSFARGKCRRASRTRGNSSVHRHRMTALLRPRLPLSTDFGNAHSSAQGSRAFKPVTLVRRAPKMWILLSSRRTSPFVFDRTQNNQAFHVDTAAARSSACVKCSVVMRSIQTHGRDAS